MNKNMKIYLQLIILNLLLITSACSSNDPPNAIMDGGLISEEPCSAPCFYGIIPGETQKVNVHSSLMEYRIDKGCSEISGGVLTCGEWLVIGFSELDLVNRIGFEPVHFLRLGDVVSKYGEPSVIQIQDRGSPENMSVAADLFYDSVSLRISLGKMDGTKCSIQPDDLIIWVTYFDKELYFQVRNINQQKWKGYGDYFWGG
jgi:hypothetical protein